MAFVYFVFVSLTETKVLTATTSTQQPKVVIYNVTSPPAPLLQGEGGNYFSFSSKPPISWKERKLLFILLQAPHLLKGDEEITFHSPTSPPSLERRRGILQAPPLLKGEGGRGVRFLRRHSLRIPDGPYQQLLGRKAHQFHQ